MASDTTSTAPHPAASLGPRWPRLRRELVIILFLTAFAIAVTWPVAPRITTEIFGSWGDVNLNFWNYWWFRYAIFELKQSPFFCPLQLYPYGADLSFHTMCPLNQVIALPFHFLFGIRFAYNFIVFMSLILAAYTAYRLAYDVCGHRFAAVAAGVMFGFSPYMLVRATGHINLIGSWPLPLVAMFSIRAFKSGRYRWAALAGLFAGLQLGISMYYTLFAAILFVLLWIYAALFERRTLRNLIWCPIVTAASALGAASPMLFIMIRSIMRSGAFFAPPTWMSFTGGVDLLGFLVPSEFSTLFGKLTWRVFGHLKGGHVEGLAFAGVICLVGAVIAVRSVRGRSKWLWTVLALLFAVAALGDRLHILKRSGLFAWGKVIPFALPTAILKFLPAINMIRVSSRFVILYQLALVCLASLGISRFLSSISSSRRNVAMPLIFILLCFELSYAPFITTPMKFGRLYEVLRDIPQEFSLMHVPFGTGDPIEYYGSYEWDAHQWLTAQVIHHRPSLGTFASRIDPRLLRKLEESPLINTIVLAQQGKMTQSALTALTPEVVRSQLSYYRLKVIVVHLDCEGLLDVGQLSYLFSHLGFKLLFVNSKAAILETPLGPSLEERVTKVEQVITPHDHLRRQMSVAFADTMASRA